MKTISLLAILLITAINVNAQGIGELAPDKPLIKFPPNALGIDLAFTEGGVGLGSFYRREIGRDMTFVTTFSFSEAKEPNEFTRIDPYTLQTYTIGKKNRVFLIPITFGLQHRLFKNSLYETLRPFVEAGIGPSIVLTTPYVDDQGNQVDFFKAFGDAHNNYALGGYIGFGANFGIDTSSLIGLNIRYYYIQLFNDGVESLVGTSTKNFGGVFISISLGKMY